MKVNIIIRVDFQDGHFRDSIIRVMPDYEKAVSYLDYLRTKENEKLHYKMEVWGVF